MREFDQARWEYENTPLPPELAERVQAGIREGKLRGRKRRFQRRFAACAACFLLLMLAGLNLVPKLAYAAVDIPVLGGLFQIMTFIDFDVKDGSINYAVSVPRLEANGDLAKTVNAAIQERVDFLMEHAKQDWAEYQDAFFSTGGTEEEWGDREMDVFVGYEVKRQTDTQVSFVVTLSEGWIVSMEEIYYFNLDFAEGRNMTLQDVLGENWVQICNDAIQEQIDAGADDDDSFFFPPDQGGFTTVDDTTTFYIREDGVPVVTFPRYAIAAGAAGVVEFPIT